MSPFFIKAQYENFATPGGVLDQNFDRFGNSYQLMQLHIPSSNAVSFEETEKFRLHFENGSGMEISSNSTHTARRKVLLYVLSDIEKFMSLPISNQKVNIWVRAFSNTTSTPTQRLGCGSSFYNVSKTTTGLIADGEVCKTLLSGKNSYTNVVHHPNDYYHGILAFNFSTYLGSTVNWHTNLSSSPTSGSRDLYSAMLKEVIHLLGLTSLMNAQGHSVFGTNYKYYSRYDTKLRNNANTQNLLVNTGSLMMYNWSYNTALSTNILRPGCTLTNQTNPNTADSTTCSNALRYVGSVNLPLYTPTCFEIGNSLSCFEDQRYPTCSTPYGNNTYFVNSNRLNVAHTKRYAKAEERIVLIDLGYNPNKTYGSNDVLNSFFTYNTSNDPIPPNFPYGINDGINLDLTFTFYGDVNQNMTISGAQLLSNDVNTTAFEGLQLVNTTGTISATSGNTSTTITFNSAEGGLHVLRYVPKNGNISGNITYVYVYLRFGNECGVANDCNLVINGDFEQLFNNVPPDNHSQSERSCNWENYTITADYFHGDSPNINYGVPINYYGNRNDNFIGNKAYMGFRQLNTNPTTGGFGETIRTELTNPLTAGVQYQLSFDVSKADILWAQNCSLPMQAFITNSNFTHTAWPFLTDTQLTQGIHLIQDQAVTSNNWTTVTFNFTAQGGERYLYLGGISVSNIAEGSGNFTYYYLDNVSLLSIDSLPEAIDDSYTFSPSTSQQTSVISVLANDQANGQTLTAPYTGITITQLSSTSPNISINATGQVVVAANTAVGTYTLTYSFVDACGNLTNAATVTVVISNTAVIFEVEEKYQHMDKCFESTNSTFDFNFFNPNNWSGGTGFLINSVPINPSLATVEVFGTPLPSELILNPNGIMYIPAIYYDEVEFYVVFRSIQNPNVISAPIRCNFSIRPFGIPGEDRRAYNLNTQSFYGLIFSTSNNILENDFITFCPNDELDFIPATSSNCIVEVTDNPNTNLYNISSTGILSVIGTPIITPIDFPDIVKYRICHPTIPDICSQEVTVKIGVIAINP